MKILSLHTDYIKWQAQKKALKSIEDLSEEELKEHEVKEALVILTAIEKNDTNIPEAIEKYTQEIKKIAEQVGAKNIVLYPYAHLSNNLGKPTNAIKILEESQKKLQKEKYNISRSPFGYYKTFELKVKGHPLSELSREIVIKGHEEEDITEEERKRLLKEISKSKLDTSKLKDNDHRIIGRKLDLWSFNETAPGMVFWHHKGLHLKNKLIELWRELHRVELSGTLSGLFRVIQFTQDDAHIFCTEKQLENEVEKIIELINKIFNTFNLKFDHIELSTRPEKRIGDEKLWDKAEEALENILKKKKIKYQINAGDGAFYGPKIDFHLKDSLNRTWQCSTIQLDMALPQRFELEYTDEKGEIKRPIMLHRVIYGAIERFLGILTEHLNGKFPLWLSPNQIKIMTMNDEVKEYAKEIYNKLFDQGFMVELDDRNESIGKKVREAQIQRFNYLVTIGEKEQEKNVIAIKKRDDEKIIQLTLEDFISQIKKEIEKKG